MMLTLEKIGVLIEAQHHEVATGGQSEIDMRFAPLVQMADSLLKYKYVIKNVAKKYNKTVTFMPKPLFSDNGSGMHVHSSLWKGGKNLYAGDGYAGLSQMAMYAIGGILKHAPVASGDHEPDDQQLQATGAGFRSPGQPGLFKAESKRSGSYSSLLHIAQGQAAGVPLS